MKLQAITTRIRTALSGVGAKIASPGTGAAGGFAELLAVLGGRAFQVSYERNKVHADLHRMDESDEIVKFALDTIASRSTGMEDPTLHAFEVNVQPAQRADGGEISERELAAAQVEIRRLIKRLRLQDEAWQIVRRFVKWGNEFRALGFDYDAGEIVTFASRPEHSMWPNTLPNGDRAPGYTQKLAVIGVTGTDVPFAEHEIIHFSFGEQDAYIGTPLLKCARKNWKRLNLAEDSTAVARLIRAFMKIIHKVPVNPSASLADQQKSIDTYKEAMTRTKVFNQDTDSIEDQDWPQTVATDLYIPDDGSGRGGIDMIDPENSQLQNISDIKYFLDRILTATTVPKRYYPFEGSTPKLSEGGGNAEDVNFACTLMMCQNVLKTGYAKLFDLQLILKGINPDDVRYDFRMANINVVNSLRDAQTRAALANTMKLWLEQYPELREKLPTMLREYGRLADASVSDLAQVELKEKPEVEPTPTPDKDDRTQLPGMGNKEAKTKV